MTKTEIPLHCDSATFNILGPFVVKRSNGKYYCLPLLTTSPWNNIGWYHNVQCSSFIEVFKGKTQAGVNFFWFLQLSKDHLWLMIDGPVHLVGVEFVLESIKLMNELLEMSIKGRVRVGVWESNGQ